MSAIFELTIDRSIESALKRVDGGCGVTKSVSRLEFLVSDYFTKKYNFSLLQTKACS